MWSHQPRTSAARCECSGGASQPTFILRCSRPRRTSGPGKLHRLGLASRTGPAFRGQEPRDGTQDSRAASRRGASGQGSGTPTPILPKGFFPCCLHVPSQKRTLKCPSPREQEQPPPGQHRGVTHSEAKGGCAPLTHRQAPLGSFSLHVAETLPRKEEAAASHPAISPHPSFPAHGSHGI